MAEAAEAGLEAVLIEDEVEDEFPGLGLSLIYFPPLAPPPEPPPAGPPPPAPLPWCGPLWPFPWPPPWLL